MMPNSTSSEKPYHRLLAVLLICFSFAMSAWISRAVFDRLPHLEDEMAYLYEARIIAGGHLVIDSPEPRQAYWQPFVVDYNGNRFGKYTVGWPAQLAVGMLLGQPWVMNAFFAAMTVALVYRLGREIFSPDVGVFAAALTAFSPMALLLNSTIMGHTSALFAATLFMYAYWRIERGRQPLRWGILAGLALGLLVTNRPLTAIAVAAPFVAWSGVRLLRTLIADVRARNTPEITQSADSLETQPPFPANMQDEVGAQHAAPLPTSDIQDNDVGLTQLTAFVGATCDPSVHQRVAPTGNLPQVRKPYDVEARPLNDAAYNPDETYAVPLQTASHLRSSGAFLSTLSPLLIVGLITLVMSLSIPLFNYLAAGDVSKNLYTLVWSYDRVGFGEGYGQHVHTLEKGVRQMRFDLSMMAADLFGWQLEGRFVPNLTGGSRWEASAMTAADGSLNPEVADHLLNQGDFYPLFGISWVLLPFGLIIAFRSRALPLALWFVIGLAGLAIPFLIGDLDTIRTPSIAWIVIIGLMGWLAAPLLALKDRVHVWTWLLVSVALALIVVHMAYWIGSQRYSTRYYSEGLVSLALLSALPLAWFARQPVRAVRPLAYGLLGAALVYSLVSYSIPRISVLHRFNLMSHDLVEAVEQRREGDQPVLVIVTGDNVRWRSYGPLMAVTSPYLDSPIVAARASNTIPRDEIIARFPDRQIIDMEAEENQSWFADEVPTDAEAVG
jgi:hypothetical protein